MCRMRAESWHRSLHNTDDRLLLRTIVPGLGKHVLSGGQVEHSLQQCEKQGHDRAEIQEWLPRRLARCP
jgi:hypothetical protein